MSNYVEGFLIPLPKRNLSAYRRMSRKAAAIWREWGALDYKECAGDDLNGTMGRPFPRGIRARRGETVILAWIVYRSRAHRDRVNRKLMTDPRIRELCGDQALFDVRRMMSGGFKVIVSLPS